MDSKKIMIVTGEASGDLHGANLVRALRAQCTEISFCGMGGTELASLGVEILCDADKVSVVGITEVFSHLKDIFTALSILKRRMISDPPDLLIIIDLPDFNLILAKKAKKLGIPVFYYIAPQVWAWRSGRVRTIKRRVDKLGVILPFEENYFKQKGVDTEYVGHPLLDTVKTTLTRDDFLQKYDIGADQRCIGLLPGSRKKEIITLLPYFLGAAELLQKNEKHRNSLVFLIPQASTITRKDLDDAGLADCQEQLNIKVITDDRYNMMSVCDGAVAASGTVTLELAILKIPMVVVYKLTNITYFLGRLLVKLDHFSLVNLIAGKTAVPELLQHEVTAANIAQKLATLIGETEEREQTLSDLHEVRIRLGERGASEKAATVAQELLYNRSS
jgi:lipid-A-disaccharide synthase